MKISQRAHSEFAHRVISVLMDDGRFLGVLAGGSAIDGSMDEHSDLDLVLVSTGVDYPEILRQRQQIAEQFGTLLYAFTGEHVGEPRLLICLYGEPLLHIDLKFVTIDDLDQRIETPIVLWDADGSVGARLRRGTAQWPNRTPEWFEERFWVWLHYSAAKLARGELFEAIYALGLIRVQILGPMVSRHAGINQRGLRRIDAVTPALSERLAATVPCHGPEECAHALREAVELYRELRVDTTPVNRKPAAEESVIDFLESAAFSAVGKRDRMRTREEPIRRR